MGPQKSVYGEGTRIRPMAKLCVESHSITMIPARDLWLLGGDGVLRHGPPGAEFTGRLYLIIALLVVPTVSHSNLSSIYENRPIM